MSSMDTIKINKAKLSLNTTEDCWQ